MINLKIKISFRVLFFWGLIGILLLIIGVYVGFSFLPNAFINRVMDEKLLREGTNQWKNFIRTPFPFNFKVYIFTIENPEDVLVGEKPIVKERGPYVYKSYSWKSEISWNDSVGELSYYDYTRYEFDQNASGNLREEDRVTILNVPLINVIYAIEMDKATADFLPLVSDALKYIFAENDGLFLRNITVKEFLFDGIRICKNGCVNDGLIPKVICDNIRKRLSLAKQMRMVGKDIMYATFHYKNNTHLGLYTIKSGKQNKKETGKLVRFNNDTFLNVWLDNKQDCNKIGGVTNVFPSNIETTTRIVSFSEDICRSIAFDFLRTDMVDGVKGYRYVALNTSMSHSSDDAPENDCFCINKTRNLDGEFGCLFDGILDLSTCQGAPVMLSFPHLLHADIRYLKSVKGLEPDCKKHEMFITLEPISGFPLKAAKRAQFNMFVRPVNQIRFLENVSDSLVPMFWIDESIMLPPEYLNMIKDKIYKALWIIDIIRYTVIAIGVAVICFCILLFIYAE